MSTQKVILTHKLGVIANEKDPKLSCCLWLIDGRKIYINNFAYRRVAIGGKNPEGKRISQPITCITKVSVLQKKTAKKIWIKASVIARLRKKIAILEKEVYPGKK